METIKALKGRLSINNTLVVQSERGYVAEALFQWEQPASDDYVKKIINDNELDLPESYINFLKISNGAVLFKDTKYGQWGCNLLGLPNMLKVTREITAQGYNIKPSQVVFATWLGDADFLLFDTEKINSGNYIIDCMACDPIEYGITIKWGFEDWLDRLIVAQGSKFWRW